jgi:hypothetical protein
MSFDIQAIMEEIQKNYQFYVSIFTLFVVCMGISRWFGRKHWLQIEKSRRNKAGLPVASLMSHDGSTEQSWTYYGLFQGGLLGLYLVAGNMTYVAIMAIKLGLDPFRENVGTVMGYPISGILFAILITINRTHLLQFMPMILRTFIGIILAIGVSFAIFIATNQMKLLYSVALYAIIMIVLSLGLSYTIGMSEGLRSADPALNYPLVTLEMRDGGRLERAWLYERTDSDYRLVTESGANHVVPATNVKEMTGPLEPPACLPHQ